MSRFSKRTEPNVPPETRREACDDHTAEGFEDSALHTGTPTARCDSCERLLFGEIAAKAVYSSAGKQES